MGNLTQLWVSRIDDELLENFLIEFAEYRSDDALRILDEEEMKSAKGKEKWRKFILPVSWSSRFEPLQLADPMCSMRNG